LAFPFGAVRVNLFHVVEIIRDRSKDIRGRKRGIGIHEAQGIFSCAAEVDDSL
jgi:hypothetical protein